MTTENMTKLGMEIASTAAALAQKTSAVFGEQTDNLKRALYAAGFKVNTDDKGKATGIIDAEHMTLDTDRGGYILTDDVALLCAVTELEYRRDEMPEDDDLHLTGPEFTEAKRTINKCLSNIAKAWDSPKVQINGSKVKGYYACIKLESESQNAEDAEAEADLVELTVDTFAADFDELLHKYNDAGIVIDDLIKVTRDKCNAIAKAMRSIDKQVKAA